jgi:hypothetical protein
MRPEWGKENKKTAVTYTGLETAIDKAKWREGEQNDGSDIHWPGNRN